MREKNIHYLIVFTGNLFSKIIYLARKITLEGNCGHKKALAGRAGCDANYRLELKNVTFASA